MRRVVVAVVVLICVTAGFNILRAQLSDPTTKPPPPSPEIRGNRVDDDKDGEVDEASPAVGAATTCGAGSPLTEHPRTWITCDGHRNPISAVKARLAGADRAIFQAFVSQFDSEMNGYAANDSKALLNVSVILVTYPVPGISYGHSEGDYVISAHRLADGVAASGLAGQDVLPVQRVIPAYDNLYPRLTPIQRTNLVRAMQNGTCGRNSTSVFHHVDVLDRMQCAYQGLAYANDGIDDAGAQQRIASIAALYDGPSSVRGALNWIGTAMLIEGWTYSQANFEGPVWTAYSSELIYEHARDVERLGPGAYPAMEQAAEWTLRMIDGYTTTAGGYQDQLAWNWRSAQTGPCFWDDGDREYGGGSCELDFASILGMVKSRNAANDVGALAEWFSATHGSKITTGTYAYRYGAYRLMYDRPAGGKSPQQLELPLSRRYDNAGVVFSRTGWESGQSHSNFVFEATPFVYDGNGYGLTARGNFTLSRTSPIITSTSLGPHHGIGTVSCGYNVMQFYKAGDTAYAAGCQRDNWMGGNNRYDVYVPGSTYDMGGLQPGTGITQLSERSDYIRVDITRAYPPATTKRDIRKLVFFKAEERAESDFVIVHEDYETAAANVEARFPLWLPGHSLKKAKPVISGHSSVGEVKRGTFDPKDTNGKLVGTHTHPSFVGANRISLDWSDLGMTIKGWISVFSSGGHSIAEIGGPNAKGEWLRDDSHEFELPTGWQMGPGPGQSGTETAHLWPWTSQYRADIIPNARSGQIVVAIEAPPASAARPTPVVQQSTPASLCAHIGTKWTYCAKPSTGSLAGAATFLFGEPGQRYARLVDLPRDTSIVLVGGSNIGTVTDIGGANCGSGCRTTAEGTLELRVNVTARGTGAENTLTIK